MTQALAIFHDAYRELNAKRLFWIVLVISGLVVAAFAAVGISSEGLTFFHWTIRIPGVNSDLISPEQFYKSLFHDWGIGVWLSWIASILALVSTAGMFPEFIAGGSIELSLAKPIGRLRLFFLKYLAGLLFVTLQVTVFTLAAFLVIGLRGKLWEPRLFLAIPIVVCLFSYLYSICVLFGLLTRSTIASLLLTLLAWFFFFLLNVGDAIIIQGSVANAMQQERSVATITRLEKSTAADLDRQRDEPTPSESSEDTPPPEPPATPATPRQHPPAELDAANPALVQERNDLESTRKTGQKWATAERIARAVKTVFPKTSETVDLLGRTLKSAEELKEEKAKAQNLPFNMGGNQREMAARMEEKYRDRTTAWVLGTSLAFEAVILAIAAFIFTRRDF